MDFMGTGAEKRRDNRILRHYKLAAAAGWKENPTWLESPYVVTAALALVLAVETAGAFLLR